MNNIELNVHRNKNAYFFDFTNHFTFATREDIGAHKKNICEKAGDVGLWIVEGLPRKIKAFITEPRVVTTALTIFALLASSFIHYPTKTYQIVSLAASFIKISFATLRLTSYIITCQLVIAAFLRAQGRLCNTELKKQFDGEQVNSIASPAVIV